MNDSSITNAAKIEAVCDVFERALADGLKPQIADFLDQIAPGLRGDLLRELIRIDCVHRRAIGESPQIADYAGQFPELTNELVSMLSAASDNSQFAMTVSYQVEESPADSCRSPTVIGSRNGNSAANPRADFGDYHIEGEIARGGMGVVYRARHSKLNRTVALKMILAGRLASEDVVKRFYSEAEAAARLDHSGIVSIYEIGRLEDQHFFSMAFVDGGSLAAKVKQGPLPPIDAAQLLKTISGAVQYAHERGVIHRDLKPANVLLDREGHPKVTDFGLAKLMDQESGLSSSGDILGTPSYMAPEQASGRIHEVGPLADVYSLGAILYCLLTGRPPFQAATLLETLQQVKEVEPVSVRLLNPAVPLDLDTICLKCLQKAPAQRYASAEELAADLGHYLRGEPILARPVGEIERTWRWCRRNPFIASLIVVSVLLVLVAFIAMSAVNQRQTAEIVAETQTYFALINEVRELAAKPRPGWTWQALDRLKTAAELNTKSRDELTLRNLATQCVLPFDMREVNVLTPFNDAILRGIAIDPKGERIAVGKHKGGLELEVAIYDASSLERIRTYSQSTLGGSISKLVQLQNQHHEGVSSLTWSPDGKYLVVGTRMGRILVWDTSSENAAPISWQAHQKDTELLAFTSDGLKLFSAHTETKAWNALSKWSSSDFFEGPAAFFSVHPNGRRIALSGNGQFRLGVVDSNAAVGAWGDKLRGSRATGRVAWHPDGRLLAVAASGPLKLIDPLFADEVATLRDDQAIGILGFSDLVFANNGALLVSADEDRRLRIWDVVNGQLVLTSPAFTADEPRVAIHDAIRRMVAIAGSRMFVYDLRLGGPLKAVGVQPTEIASFDLAASCEELATVQERSISIGMAARYHEAIRWNTTTDRVNSRHAIVAYSRPNEDVSTASAIALSRDRQVAFASSPQFGAYEWDSRSGRFIEHPSLRPLVLDESAVAVSDERITKQPDAMAVDGQSMRWEATKDQPSKVELVLNREYIRKWPGDTWAFLFRIRVERLSAIGQAFTVHSSDQSDVPPISIPACVLPTDGYFWLSTGTFPRSHIERSPTLRFSLTLTADDSPSCVWLDQVCVIPYHWPKTHVLDRAVPSLVSTRDDRYLLGIVNNEVKLASWLRPTLALNGEFDHSVTIEALTSGTASILCLDTQKNMTVAGLRRGAIVVASPADLKNTTTFPVPNHEPVNAVALSSDETRIATGTPSGKVVCFNSNGKLLNEWSAHPEGITSLDDSENGEWLVTAGEDKTIRMWKRERDHYSEFLTFTLGLRPASLVRLSADSRWLSILVRGERAVRIIDLTTLNKAHLLVGLKEQRSRH